MELQTIVVYEGNPWKNYDADLHMKTYTARLFDGKSYKNNIHVVNNRNYASSLTMWSCSGFYMYLHM